MDLVASQLRRTGELALNAAERQLKCHFVEARVPRAIAKVSKASRLSSRGGTGIADADGNAEDITHPIQASSCCLIADSDSSWKALEDGSFAQIWSLLSCD